MHPRYSTAVSQLSRGKEGGSLISASALPHCYPNRVRGRCMGGVLNFCIRVTPLLTLNRVRGTRVEGGGGA